jgi:hypothetical protein
LQWIEDKDFIQLIKKEKNFIECSIDDEVNAAQLNTLLLNDGIPLTHLVVRTRKLEEEFITITSK